MSKSAFIFHWVQLLRVVARRTTMDPGPPVSLVGSFRWAQKTVEWCKAHAESSWLMSFNSLPTSSWFSGYGCAEIAMEMLNKARVESGCEGHGFSPSYQFEIATKARSCAASRLDQHVCQHVDILTMLGEKDRQELKGFEKSSKSPSEDIWDFLLKKGLVKDALCSRHGMRRGSFKKGFLYNDNVW